MTVGKLRRYKLVDLQLVVIGLLQSLQSQFGNWLLDSAVEHRQAAIALQRD
jgi:NADH:ubiquinone oxidoreductase subunit E